jgi:hypothetical protein
MDRHEDGLQELAKDMTNVALKGIINIQNKPGFLPGRKSAEYDLFSSTLISSMIYLDKCGIKPYKNEDKS